jgi:hypothetical protein
MECNESLLCRQVAVNKLLVPGRVVIINYGTSCVCVPAMIVKVTNDIGMIYNNTHSLQIAIGENALRRFDLLIPFLTLAQLRECEQSMKAMSVLDVDKLEISNFDAQTRLILHLV